jgi:glutamate-1-semialdehyde aminotransferase
MAPAAKMFISSTYWSDTIGLRAALTTLREIKSRDVPAALRKIGTELKTRLNGVAREVGLDVRCGGLTVHPHLEFKIDDAATKSKVATLFIQEMAKRGCHGYTSFYLNAAQGPRELDQTENAARETFAVIAEGLRSGRLDELLECDLQQDTFRRLVR